MKYAIVHRSQDITAGFGVISVGSISNPFGRLFSECDGSHLPRATKQQTSNSLLDALATKDLRGNHVKNALLNVGLSSKFLELLDLMH
jgi:hypothetical protein